MIEVLIGIASLILTLIVFLFERGWLPPKYRMTSQNPLDDPIISKIIGPSNKPQFKSTIIVPYMIPKYENDGYEKMRIAFGHRFRWGRQCVWTGKVSDGSIQECILMIKSSNLTAGNKLPLS